MVAPSRTSHDSWRHKSAGVWEADKGHCAIAKHRPFTSRTAAGSGQRHPSIMAASDSVYRNLIARMSSPSATGDPATTRPRRPGAELASLTALLPPITGGCTRAPMHAPAPGFAHASLARAAAPKRLLCPLPVNRVRPRRSKAKRGAKRDRTPHATAALPSTHHLVGLRLSLRSTGVALTRSRAGWRAPGPCRGRSCRVLRAGERGEVRRVPPAVSLLGKAIG